MRRDCVGFAMQDNRQTHTEHREPEVRRDYVRVASLRLNGPSSFIIPNYSEDQLMPSLSTARVRVCTITVAVWITRGLLERLVSSDQRKLHPLADVFGIRGVGHELRSQSFK